MDWPLQECHSVQGTRRLTRFALKSEYVFGESKSPKTLFPVEVSDGKQTRDELVVFSV